VPVDPRDEEAVRALEKSCNRLSNATLKVVNRSTFDVKLTIIFRSGGNWPITGFVPPGRSGYTVPRHAFESGGGIVIVPVRGGMSSGDGYVSLMPLQCDVGTLEIGPTLNQSYFTGADWGE
jgi:hypothetical protein